MVRFRNGQKQVCNMVRVRFRNGQRQVYKIVWMNITGREIGRQQQVAQAGIREARTVKSFKIEQES